jgi:uncharacterized membrane protein
MQQPVVNGRVRNAVIAIDRSALWLSQHWLAGFIVLYGVWVWAPFLAPLLMQWGARDQANSVYTFYSFFCHQLPERSLFLFGSQTMYSLDQIKSVWDQDGFLGLRQFNGNIAMGYKVAWSDRMISFYGSVWLGALIYTLIRNRRWRLNAIVWVVLGILPVGIDGVSHMVNDVLAGTSGAGFRDTNLWLVYLTDNAFPASFYIGDALGSFNSWMRWITGITFGITSVLFTFPYLEAAMRDLGWQAVATLERARQRETM